ncbi:MAG: ATP-dependent helicase [Burkholderiales bacterium]|nr:ATP-dependent helicase [Burkholderiales bacterium]
MPADACADSRAEPRHDVHADPFGALNAQQRSAVEHGLERMSGGGPPALPGPMLVIAGAGSGTTLTRAARVARLVLAGADPQRLLLLTFSRRAAHEMERRVGRLLHQALGYTATQRAPRLYWAGTFHGIGARLLREYAAQIGLAENFTIQDRGDSEDLMGLVRHELQLAGTKQRFPLKGTCLAIYSRVVNSREPLAEVLRGVYPWCAAWEDELKRLFRAYVAEKQNQCVLDYDDLLLYWSQMLEDAALALHVAARFDHVLVDEYQDTNRLQAAILLALKPDGRGLTVVGDDAQSIYAFRAAEVRNILDFPDRFTPPARVVALERNYRSTQPILDASNGVIALAAQRFTKQLWSDAASAEKPSLVTVHDESAQADWVADQVLRHREHGIALKSQAVLFRTAHHSAALELELTRRNIPFVKFGGLKFLEAAHVKDVLSVLRWAQNPRSRMAALRVAQLVPGIGTASAKRLADAMGAAADPVRALHAYQPPPAAAAEWPALVTLFGALQAGTSCWPADLEQVHAWYLPHLRRLHDDARVREGDLAQLARIAASYASREVFLTELTLDPPEATSDESGPPLRDEDYLILSTIHSAKGQEWRAVYVLNVVDGCIPSDMATGHAAEIDEERRLLYVAMTRARQHLHLLVPQRFYVTQQAEFGDRHLYGALTRFIPPALAGLFEPLCAPPPCAAAGDTLAAAAPIDVAARVRSQWS